MERRRKQKTLVRRAQWAINQSHSPKSMDYSYPEKVECPHLPFSIANSAIAKDGFCF
jgi:hypothetical protein